MLQFSCVGGERDRLSLAVLAFLVPPHCAVTAYLEPISGSLQKTIGGLSLFARKHAKPMLKTALNKGGGTRPEQTGSGRSEPPLEAIYRGGISSAEQQFQPNRKRRQPSYSSPSGFSQS
jgi:hypothetical protein